MEIFFSFLQLVVFLGVIICLIVISLRFSGKKYNDLQKGKYIKVVERVQLSKENSINLIKIGDKGYVVSSSSNGTQTIIELSEEEILKIEEQKIKANEILLSSFNNFKNSKLKEKIKSKIRGQKG